MKKDDGSATTFGYSPDGIVRTKQWVTSSPQTTQKRRYVYDRTLPYAQLLQEWDNVGNAVMADYLYLDGDLIGFKDERAGSAARYWVLKDGQNSVRKVVDASASVVASYDYTAFGEVLNPDQPSGWIFNHRAFGEIYDAQLEMTYLRARWMDPTTGRFASRDPFGGSSLDPQSLHRFTYAKLDPLGDLDPSGELALSLVVLLVVIEFVAMASIAHGAGPNDGDTKRCDAKLTNNSDTDDLAALIFAENGNLQAKEELSRGAVAIASVMRNRLAHLASYPVDRRDFGRGTKSASPAVTLTEVMAAGNPPYRTKWRKLGWRPDVQFDGWQDANFKLAKAPDKLYDGIYQGQSVTPCERFKIAQEAAQKITGPSGSFFWFRTAGSGGPDTPRCDLGSGSDIAGNTFWPFKPECVDPNNAACKMK